MRAFVVRHSVFRIHGVVVFAMLAMVAAIFARSPVLADAEIIPAIIAVASLITIASTYCIGKALGTTHGK